MDHGKYCTSGIRTFCKKSRGRETGLGNNAREERRTELIDESVESSVLDYGNTVPVFQVQEMNI